LVNETINSLIHQLTNSPTHQFHQLTNFPVTLSSILFLFLTHLAAGITWTLLLVSKQAGVKFFRFNAGVALALVLVGMAFRPAEAAGWAGVGRLASPLLGLAAAALALYWISVGRMLLRRVRPALLPIAACASATALAAQAMGVSSGASLPLVVLTLVSFFASAALLGGACTSMILGHWYLVLPSMDVFHLQSMVRFHIVSVILRVVVVAGAVFLAIASWQPGEVSFERYIFSVGGVFFWQRVLFGLVGPAVLAYLTWETAKIRSTQSATGILYVDFFAVIVGEVLAKYLFLATSVPV
jgi:protein NrfD